MKLKGIVVEDFGNYRKPSLFLATATCDWKCCVEADTDISMCQNAPLARSPTIDISYDDIYHAFADNDITQAVVVGGLEPLLQFEELLCLIAEFRGKHRECCDFVIYTGYYPNEIENETEILSRFENIIVKFGRYIPGDKPKYDEVLGVTLSSGNQFARRIS